MKQKICVGDKVQIKLDILLSGAFPGRKLVPFYTVTEVIKGYTDVKRYKVVYTVKGKTYSDSFPDWALERV